MHRLTFTSTIIASVLVASGACTEHASSNSTASTSTPAATNASAKPTSGTAAAPGAPPAGSPCDRKLITTEDVAGILSAPITSVKNLAGDPQTCSFKTDGFAAISVTVRAGLGNATVGMYADGKIQVEVSPLSGVGERAFWQPELHEVIATKNNVLCDIQARGIPQDLASSEDAQQKKIGGLCNKIFAMQ